VDSDDELPCIKFSCSNVPSVEQKTNETAVSCTDRTDLSSGSSGRGDAAAESVAGAVVLVDSDSSDSDSWKECMLKYSRSLRERCNATTVLSSADYASQSAESCDLQLGVGSAAASLTDDQSCCNSLTDDSPAAWKSYENSEEVAPDRLSQTTTSDLNSQTSSVQSDDKRKRKRPQKADDPDVVACILCLLCSLLSLEGDGQTNDKALNEFSDLKILLVEFRSKSHGSENIIK